MLNRNYYVIVRSKESIISYLNSFLHYDVGDGCLNRGIEIEQMLDELADSPKNIKAMVMENWCKPVVDRLCRGSAKSKLEMAKALAKFDLDDSCRESLIDAHVIEALVDILKSRQLESKLASLKALENLSCQSKASNPQLGNPP